MQTNEPRELGSVSVWLTIMVLKAAKGQGVPVSELRAALAWRIQCARVLKEMLLSGMVGSLAVLWL